MTNEINENKTNNKIKFKIPIGIEVVLWEGNLADFIK